MNDNGEDAIALEECEKVIDGPWGYACVQEDAVFIPAVQATPEWPLRRVLAHLFEQTGKRRIVFSAVLDAASLKTHLRRVVKEWDEWVPMMEDYSHCIAIDYEPPKPADAVLGGS